MIVLSRRFGCRIPFVLRYRIQLQAKHLPPATINLRLAAVRRLAYEAADVGLLSPDAAAGIRRVRSGKRLGARLGNWLGAQQAKNILSYPNGETLIRKRDGAILALLLSELGNIAPHDLRRTFAHSNAARFYTLHRKSGQ
jgi:site-specific recombinase XerC